MAILFRVTLRRVVNAMFPGELVQIPPSEALDWVWVNALDVNQHPFQVRTSLLFEVELAVGIPGIDAVQIVFAGEGLDTVVPLEFDAEPTPTITMPEPRPTIKIGPMPIALRFSRDLLKPARRVPGVGDAPDQIVEDTDTPRVDITLGRLTFAVDFDGNISVDASAVIELPMCLIGDTGVAIEAEIGLYFGLEEPPPGKPTGWRGVHGSAGLYLPGELGDVVGHLELINAYIGNGGFTGEIRNTWPDPPTASLFGISFGLHQVDIALVQNAFTRCQIKGVLTVPFFNGPADVLMGISADGSFVVSLDRAAAALDGTAGPGGLVTLNVPNVLSMTLSSIGVVEERGVWLVKVSGSITPLIAGLDWPTFEIQELSIDSDGHVKLEGGWIDLPDSYSLTFYGFTITVSRIGFGNAEDGGHWIGFSGGLRLVDGFQAGASVDGLKITWYDHVEGEPDRQPKLTLNGVAIDFLIEDTLRFAGAVAYHELQAPGSPDVEHRFDGQLTLDLLALDFEIDSRIVIGSHDGPSGSYQYLAIYVSAELPFGIPLASTGLALYGMAGLFALNMEPDKGPAQPWYSTGTEDWFHHPEPGVAVLTKWRNQLNSLALGAGVTIGTLSDNGYIFSGKFLLVFIFPGPIIMLEGKANLLKQRAQLDGGDPLFRALTVLDFRVGLMLMGLDVHYKYKANGQLLDLHGGSEAFFDFHDGSIWHIYLGEREPRTRRIRADLFNRLIQANAYFMIDAQHFATGAWAGLDKSWNYGPVSLTVQVWIELNAELSYKPTQFHGELGMHGGLALHLFGFGFEVALDARLAADTPHPYHILGHFDVALSLPVPLPSYSASVSLEWGPVPDRPPIPLPLKEVTVEHFKTTTCWPLPRQGAEWLLVPDYDDGAGFLREFGVDPYDERTAPPDYAPVVPLDCRPRLTFGCSVNDDAGIGVNAHLAEPEWERIGDPARNEGPMLARYGLKQVVLDRWDVQSRTWLTEAYRGGPTPPGATASQALFGSWAPLPQIPSAAGDGVGHTKLWLWSQNPFDYTRRTGGAWEEWFASRYPDYPCLPALKEHVVCADFEENEPGRLPDGWEHPDVPGLIFGRGGRKGKTVITELDEPAEDLRRAICIKAAPQSAGFITVALPRQTRAITFLLLAGQVAVFGQESDGTSIPGSFDPDGRRVRLSGSDLTRVVFNSTSGSICIAQICMTIGPEPRRMAERAEMIAHLQEEVTRWQQVGAVLRPHSQYRLKVVTAAEVKGEGELASYEDSFTQSEYAFFRTEGPPALANLSLPVGVQDALIDEATLLDRDAQQIDIDGRLSSRRVLKSELNDLTRYVRQTNPPTVPAPGEPPVLTRPVYRGYDVGVEFNENYVDLLYRMERRDLGLYLFDQNNRPVRDVEGRIVSLDNLWRRSATRDLARSDRRWEALLRNNDCQLGFAERPHDSALLSMTRAMLEPGSLYEGRLIPLLLHDDFAGYGESATVSGPAGVLSGWHVHDEGTDGPSLWEVGSEGAPASFFITQTSRLMGGTSDLIGPVEPGTLLVFQEMAGPGQWTDYRLSLHLRRGAGQIIGVVFRFSDDDHHYRWTLDDSHTHQLVRVVKGTYTILVHGTAVVNDEQDVLLTIEAIGDHLRGYLDGRPLFDATDASCSSGAIGLYCRNNPQARFANVRVEDFRPEATVAYRFQFVTSRFVNFFHHLHSYQDETWRLVPASHSNLDSLLSRGVEPTSAPTEEEARAYDSLAEVLLGGPASVKAPGEVQVSRLDRAGAGPLLLLHSPEPIDWKRTSLSLWSAAEATPAFETPREVKLTDVRFASSPDGEESVTLLIREATNLTGYRIEHRQLPGPLEDSTLLAGFVFRDHFAEGNLEDWRFLDQSKTNSPSRWEVDNGELTQRSLIGDEFLDWRPLLGTQAIAGPGDWNDVAIEVRLREPENGTIGLVFRRMDDSNYYEFVLGPSRQALVKYLAGSAELLWERATQSRPGVLHLVSIITIGSTLRGFVDSVPLFVLDDTDFAAGTLALSCSGNDNARFSDLRVYPAELAFNDWLLDESFDTLAHTRWTFPQPEQTTESQWRLDFGRLRHTTDLRTGDIALAGDRAWTDVRVALRVGWRIANGSFGVLCRARDLLDHYRFVITPPTREAQLVCRLNGSEQTLWQGTVILADTNDHLLTFDCVGQRLTAQVDGFEVVSLQDSNIANGSIGLYSSSDAEAGFIEVRVSTPVWKKYYEFGLEDTLAAGTRVRTTTVLDEGSTLSETGEVQRLIAPDEGHTWPRLDSRGAELRVRAPHATKGHSRWFGNSFVPVLGMRVLRKRDGTGLALVLNEDTPEPKQHRLAFTYRRDNGSAGGAILSQAGDRSDELVKLDIPYSTLVEVR